MGVYLTPGDRAELLSAVQERLLESRARAEESAREEGRWMRIAVTLIGAEMYPDTDDES